MSGHTGATNRSGALDGMRGVFLAGPIIVHLQLAGSGNGLWLSIGLFFALSGFLITTLALQEVERTGGLSLRKFWARRFRRLMPAAIAVLLATVVAAWLLEWPALGALRDDVIAALTWRANWHQISGGGYWAGFAPSLTSHFWSLSLEEQVYLVLPLLVIAGASLRRHVRPAVAIGVLSAVVWAVSWAVLWSIDDPTELYLSTVTRAGEAAAGAVAACVSFLWPARAEAPRRATWIVAALAVVELPVWITSHGDTTSGIRLGITLSTPAVAVAVALLWRHPSSGAARLFSLRPLVWLGRRSYGIYLLHIPVFELTAFHLGVERMPAWAMVATTAGTVALAGVMFRLVEEPVRIRRIAPSRTQFTGLLVAGSLALVAVAWAGGRRDPGAIQPPEDVTPPVITVVTVPTTAAPGEPGEPAATTVPGPPPTAAPTRFPIATGSALVVGDSTAWVSNGAVRDALGPLGWTVEGVHMVGCPPGGDVRMKTSQNGGEVYARELGEEPGCDQWWDASLPSWLADRQPSLVVVVGNYGLAYEVDPDADDRWCRLGDGSGRCETWATARLAAVTARIAEYSPGSHVVWTTPAHIDPFGPLDVPPGAIDSLITLVRAEAARSGASVVDLGAWIDAHLDLTVDGTHLGPDGVAALTPWMAVELPAAIAGERLAAPETAA